MDGQGDWRLRSGVNGCGLWGAGRGRACWAHPAGGDEGFLGGFDGAISVRFRLFWEYPSGNAESFALTDSATRMGLEVFHMNTVGSRHFRVAVWALQ